MKYRKKPIVIEAFKWTGGEDQAEDPEWVVEKIKDGTVYFSSMDGYACVLCIKTLEGTMTAIPGDYIIKGLRGELYPCKPYIFDASYESAELAPTVEPPRGAWISVTRSLPEPGDTKYLVCCRTAKGLRSINMAWFDGTFWHGMGSMAGVTHWMPLPDLPEVGE